MKFNRQALRVSLVYCLGAGLWIIVTNWLVHRYTSNADLLERLQDFKGCFFVLLTALLLYLALSRIFRRMEREEARRRLSSEALWASEVHYRSLFDNMQEGFAFCRMIYDNGRPVDFIYLEVNRNFEKLTGLRDVAGRKVSEAIPGLREANPELFEIYGRVVATGQPEHFELFIQPLNAWLSISAYALEKGCFVAVFENITGRKQSEAERQQKAALFEALVNSLPEGILVVSGERKKILQNEQFNKLLKIPPHIAKAASMADDSEQLKFVTDSTRHPEQFRDKVLYLEAHPEETSRDEIEFKDGRILDRNTAPAFGKNKEYYGRIWTFRDISERKQAEAQYQVQSAALSAAANAIVIADRQGTIRWVNAAFTRLTGYTFAEAVGQNPRVLKSGQHDDAFYQSMWETVLRGDVWRGELVNKRKDGSLYTEDMTITPVRSAGNGITHFIAIKQDVTENRLLEEKLRQSQKMEAFGQLAGGVAHDFNNAMSVIQLQADMLKGEGGLSPNQNLLVDEIGKAVQHSSHLARQLLLFSRKKKPEMRRLDLNETVAGIIKMLQRILGEDIRTQFSCQSALLPVNADAGMLEQVLVNLAANARDAMPAGGKLTVETMAVELDEPALARMPQGRPGLFVRLSVSDTGNGIPPEILPRIFEPFFTTKDAGKGTGLGLATVFGIVQQHQGWINVESTAGKGTSFQIYLPVQAGENDAFSAALPNRELPAGRETILLVEDEPSLRLTVQRALSRLGYRVIEAGDGAQARKEWRQQNGKIDLVLTDMILPDGINGRELAEELRRDQPGLKVIYTSGYSPEIAGGSLSLKEGYNFLPKPLELMKLAETVRARLDG